MKALVLSGKQLQNGRWGDPVLQVEERPIPEPAAEELLIRVYACGICGTDVHCTRVNEQGELLYNGPVKLPVILGHEFAGVVAATGPHVRHLKTGDLIAGESLLGCGVCRYCRGGAPNQCPELQMLGLNRDGAFAEYVVIPERHAWNIGRLLEIFPSNRQAAEAASIIEPLGCAYNALFINGGGVMPGENAIVYGCGPIGLGAIALLRLAGAGNIMAVEPQHARRQLALECGANQAISPDNPEQPLPELLRQCTGVGTAEIQIECAGAIGELMPLIERCMAPRGRFIYVGRSDNQPVVNMNNLVTLAGRINGSRGHVGGNVFPNLINLLASRRLNIDKLITHRYPFSKILQAMEMAASGNSGKVTVQMGQL